MVLWIVMVVMSCRYHRLPLPVEGAPLEEHFDAFVSVLRVSSVLILGVQAFSNTSTVREFTIVVLSVCA